MIEDMVRVNEDGSCERRNAVNARMDPDGQRKPNDSDAVDGEDSPLQSKRSSRCLWSIYALRIISSRFYIHFILLFNFGFCYWASEHYRT